MGREFAHADIQQYSEPHHIGDNGGPPVRNKGERDADNGHKPHDHTGIDKYLPENHGGDAEGQDGPEHIAAVIGNV